MNGKERMRLAMLGEKPDRIPLMCQLATGHIFKNAGLSPLEYWFSPEGYVEGNIRMVDRYKFDGILSDACEIYNPKDLSRIGCIEETAGGYLASCNNEEKLLFPYDDNPRFINEYYSPEITEIEDIDIGGIQTMNSEEDIPEYHKEVLDNIIRRRGTELSVHGEVGTAFEKLLFVTGSAEYGLVALLDNPEKCMAILEKMNRSVIIYALYQCKRGIDALKLSSPFAGAGFISRSMYEAFVLPFEKELIAAVKEKFRIPCYIHTCGKIGDRLDLIVKSGVDGIECLDPLPLGNVDLEKAVEEIGDKVFIKGNLDSVNELMNKSKNEIDEIVHKRTEIGRRVKKGFILSTACSLSPKVPPENVALLHEALEKYGRY